MPKFKIIEGEGIDTVMEKSEHLPTQFNVKDVKTHLDAVNKAITELEAKIKLEEAIVGNIERNHPGILVLEEEIRQACYLYMKSKMAIVPAQEQLDGLKKSMEEYKEEIDSMAEQTGINIFEL
jgi:uncharacterized coiled-coil DUF342 family protein